MTGERTELARHGWGRPKEDTVGRGPGHLPPGRDKTARVKRKERDPTGEDVVGTRVGDGLKWDGRRPVSVIHQSPLRMAPETFRRRLHHVVSRTSTTEGQKPGCDHSQPWNKQVSRRHPLSFSSPHPSINPLFHFHCVRRQSKASPSLLSFLHRYHHPIHASSRQKRFDPHATNNSSDFLGERFSSLSSLPIPIAIPLPLRTRSRSINAHTHNRRPSNSRQHVSSNSPRSNPAQPRPLRNRAATESHHQSRLKEAVDKEKKRKERKKEKKTRD
ncbi:hypothetical protein BKA80DRAFT_91971 [Phyllosticta citrichinensis]